VVAPVLLVEDLVKRFDTPEGPITAIDRVSFSVAQGELISLIGPSGCGKSTVFNIVGGLVPMSQGRVLVNGEAIAGPHAAIGMVFQEESTFPWRTVLDNVAFPLEIAGLRKAERIERAMHYVKLVGLDGFQRRYPAELSGGMRQRVSIARAFAGRPDILLCDEPFSALDEHTGNALRDEFRELLRETGATGIFITHSIEEALRLGGRLIVFERPARIAYEAHSLAGLSDAEREAVRAGIRQVLAADVAA
jgi:NitT/TauT family transport system ATP-binding protein